MAIKIAIFNHKGGVGKTTTVFNLGWKLAALGKKVLLVDADTQCNLTLQILGEDKYEDYYEKKPKHNIKSYLAPAFDSQPILIKPAEVIQVKQQPNLSLIAGSLDLSSLDTQLGMSFHLTSLISSMQNLPGSFDFLIQRTAEANQIDYVLLDLNPSLSAINQDLLLSSDYFLIPTSPDYFSRQSIKSLATILPKWENWAVRAREVFKEVIYPLPLNTPKFLGFTTNRFQLNQSATPSKAQRDMMDKVGQAVDNFLVPSLKKCNMLLNEEVYHQYPQRLCKTQSNYCIVEISDFYRVDSLSQKNNIPVFLAKDEDLAGENQRDTRDWFEGLYTYFANEIINRTDYAEHR